jgi:hypothetical protein
MSTPNIKTLTLDGVTRSIVDWSSLMGIEADVIRRRIASNWSVQDILTTPVNRPTVSKTDAERALNEMMRNQLPSQLEKLVPKVIKTIRLGTYIREEHRTEFNEWFDKIFVPNHKEAP